MEVRRQVAVVLEAVPLNEAELAAYCRRKDCWWSSWNNRAGSTERAPDKNRIWELERDLLRKEKALVETAALLVLSRKPRISLFAEHEREDRRTKSGDPLIGLTKHVDFEALAAGINAAAPRSRVKGGRPPYSTEWMAKTLVLQQLYNLADDALEHQLLDWRSFLQLLDLTESSSIPDAKTIWLFRERLARAGVGNQIFEQVQQQLQQHCYMARCGQIVDASLVHAPVQRNKREEANTVKDGTIPLGWKPHKRAQKTSTHAGRRNTARDISATSCASVDKRYKLMRKMVVTHAAVADTTVFEPLLDLANTSRDVYADRGGYPSTSRNRLVQLPIVSFSSLGK